MRKAAVTRKTNETEIAVEIDLDGSGASDIATGVGFFDHMLDQLARHSLIDIRVSAKGDLHIDDHHTVEDVGIALGQALKANPPLEASRSSTRSAYAPSAGAVKRHWGSVLPAAMSSERSSSLPISRRGSLALD